MGLSKSNRIIILLIIDSAFFLLELIVGYAVHSLALVADSFHMLNDVLSLCVGLWAVKVANSSANNKMYTYGWQRAETLGALINGVFLVALCFSIFLEAIQRFVEPQVISRPQLVLIVGCCGLASNLLGLVLFHDHGHSHGGSEEEHNHDHSDPISNAEEGHSHGHSHSHDGPETSEDRETRAFANESGNVADVLPQTAVGAWQKPAHEDAARRSMEREFTRSDEDDSTATITSPKSHKDSTGGTPHARHRRRTSASLGRGFGSVDNIHVHPASFRNEIIAAGRLDQVRSEDEDDQDEEEEEQAVLDDDGDHISRGMERTRDSNGHISSTSGARSTSRLATKKKDYGSLSHAEHKHAQPAQASGGGGGGHGHSHDLNMRGIFLHVMGDALGNIGVIASALFIWLTDFSWRYYSDPAISLIITCIILGSAIPLCKAASRILLQAVPSGMSVDDIKDDIESLPNVLGCHHLHVWQLSDTKLVASLHIKVDCDIKGIGSGSYMELAHQVRRCLHEYGIHSATIQPEFCNKDGSTDSSATQFDTDNDHSYIGNGKAASRSTSGAVSPPAETSKAASIQSDERRCLLDCADECKRYDTCCPQPKKS